jgi:hypothetical protein
MAQTYANISLQGLKNNVDRLVARLSAFETAIAKLNAQLANSTTEDQTSAVLCQLPIGLHGSIQFTPVTDDSELFPTLETLQTTYGFEVFPSSFTNNQSYIEYNLNDKTDENGTAIKNQYVIGGIRYSMFFKINQNELSIFCEGHQMPDIDGNKLELFVLKKTGSAGTVLEWFKLFELKHGVVDSVIKEDISLAGGVYSHQNTQLKWEESFNAIIGNIKSVVLIYILNTVVWLQEDQLTGDEIPITEKYHTLIPVVTFVPLYNITRFGSTETNYDNITSTRK